MTALRRPLRLLCHKRADLWVAFLANGLELCEQTGTKTLAVMRGVFWYLGISVAPSRRREKVPTSLRERERRD